MKNKDFSDIVEMIKKTYGFYRQKYVVMSSKYTKTVNHYFTDKVIESHLNGSYALATFAGEKVTRFLSIDIDDGGKKAVRQVMDAFVELGIPRDRIYVSISGRKGYHVDIFFSPWLYNEKAKNLYDLMIWRSGLNPKKVEFRPTNRQAVKVPLGVHAATGRRCWYLDRETMQPIEQMEYIKEITPIPNNEIYEILKAWNKKRWNELYADMICNDTGRDDSIQHDIEFNSEYYEKRRIVECGTRHNVMVGIACDLRHYGANRFQIRKALNGFYYKQDPTYIETSEEEVLEDIDAIAGWAEECVPIWKYRRGETINPKPVVFNKEDINYILMGPTNAARKVAFLIWAYCKLFGASHISYATIAKTVGCRVATVETAVKKLIENHVINRKSGGCHYRNGMLVRESNTYFIPSTRNLCCPAENEIVCDTYSFAEQITAESFDRIYYGFLASMCTIEYLAKFLTKPELSECRKRVEANAESGSDSGDTACCSAPGSGQCAG